MVVFDWQKNDWADHIGFVEAINGKTITTIKGNTRKQVARRTYPWNDWRIVGYARPKYPSASHFDNRSVYELANEVIQGKWGNGDEYISLLKKSDYDPSAVHKEVKYILQNNSRKSNEAIAKEVIQRKWGNGQERQKRLEKAGYNYTAIQKIVNKSI